MDELLQHLPSIFILFGSVIGFFMGFQKLQSRFESMEAITKQRLDFLQEQVDGIENKHETLQEVLIAIKVELSSIRTDIDYIKKNLDKL